MAAVRCDLEDFAAEMFEPFARADQRRWGEVYLRGLLLDGGRKSVESIISTSHSENRGLLPRTGGAATVGEPLPSLLLSQGS
ncbi:hypothetical protein GCM10010272_66440 [Streptomyces lateritius]|uniref:transposase n=2 Tax=Streptomyces lateritius TaxID=67313 RepID=UPI0019BE5DB8|nr:hypothetical protein GCM10010272_66440 [Streptomyces lateritius]